MVLIFFPLPVNESTTTFQAHKGLNRLKFSGDITLDFESPMSFFLYFRISLW